VNRLTEEELLLQREARFQGDSHPSIEVFDRDSNDPLALGILLLAYETRYLLG
jgi:hypothetical protein